MSCRQRRQLFASKRVHAATLTDDDECTLNWLDGWLVGSFDVLVCGVVVGASVCAEQQLTSSVDSQVGRWPFSLECKLYCTFVAIMVA